ncbi:MAG: FmdE family protein [Thiovulaceae bacterium]|nr:FmdE family protein [Sulfurimonadaceae bacterium]
MNYPNFFDQAPVIILRDPLSELLGAFDDGLVRFSYLDAVKLAGHSCPTVAGAFLMTAKALQELYPNDTPIRGNIKVAFKDSIEDGVTGVIANVISLITGATHKSGFKGLKGNFARHSLMDFETPINASVRFTRTDTGKSADLFYNPDIIKTDPKQLQLMKKIISNEANTDEKNQFGVLWQARVKKIFDNANNEELLKVGILS